MTAPERWLARGPLMPGILVSLAGAVVMSVTTGPVAALPAAVTAILLTALDPLVSREVN
jgi:hypothetical protein